MAETKRRRFPARRLTLEEAAADPNNVVIPAGGALGLRFPVVIYGGWDAVGEAFGELALQRNSLLTGGPAGGKLERVK